MQCIVFVIFNFDLVGRHNPWKKRKSMGIIMVEVKKQDHINHQANRLASSVSTKHPTWISSSCFSKLCGSSTVSSSGLPNLPRPSPGRAQRAQVAAGLLWLRTAWMTAELVPLDLRLMLCICDWRLWYNWYHHQEWYHTIDHYSMILLISW